MTISSPYGAPGVYTSQILAGPTPGPSTVSPSVAGFIGEHWRGPSLAVQCNGWGDFLRYFGGFNPGTIGTTTLPTLANSYLPYVVYEFFANGGSTCWVYRATASGTPGSSGSTTLADSAATPQNTLTLTAGVLGVPGNVGVWGNQLFVDVVSDVAAGTGKFSLNIYYGPSATPQYLVEQWVDLSMLSTDPRYVVTIINSTVQGSAYVVATALTDTNATVTPAVVTGKQFTGGVNPADPAVADYVAMLSYGNQLPTFQAPFDLVPGVINMTIPGLANTTSFTTPNVTTILNQGIAYANARPYTFFVVDPPSGQTPAGAVSFATGLTPASADMAIYYPWLNATNPSSSNLQSTILLPPSGFVLGQMTAMDDVEGVWTAPAGLQTVFTNVVSAERRLTTADIGALNSNNVNSLRTRSNGQVLIWGTRTLQTGFASLYVPVERTLNYIEAALSALLEFAVFQPNDALLWANITSVCTSFLDGLLAQGAFPSTTASNSYYVTCNSTNNTPATVTQGVVNTTVGIALQYPAEFINLVIAQFQTTGQTTVSSIT